GGERIAEVVVATRRRGELAYRPTLATPRGDARWRARVSLDAATRPFPLEYYVEAHDLGGVVIGRVAGPDAPLDLAIAPGGAVPPVAATRPWYGRWYVIAGAAALAAGTTGLVLFATRGPDPGSLPPGSVTVSP
ncbi:MAG: hypothetical protein NT062_00550, partial [Proteobacteria bacterium]|nr:hypothetical protein [Pseudomonadota bacterium]